MFCRTITITFLHLTVTYERSSGRFVAHSDVRYVAGRLACSRKMAERPWLPSWRGLNKPYVHALLPLSRTSHVLSEHIYLQAPVTAR